MKDVGVTSSFRFCGVPKIWHNFSHNGLLITVLVIYPFMPNGIFYLHFSDRSISNVRVVRLRFDHVLLKFLYNVNSVDPDQTPRSAASDLGLTVLPMSFLWDFCLNGLSCIE